jgi:hypothetical protein
MKRISLLLLALAACGGSSAQPKAATSSSGTCDKVADHVVSLMSAGTKSSDSVDPFRKIITKRCNEDGWSADAQNCLLGITALDQGDACEKQLTEAQAKAFEADTQAAEGKIGGGNAAPPPPSPVAPASQAAPMAQPAPGAPPAARATSPRTGAPAQPKKNSSDPDEGGD